MPTSVEHLKHLIAIKSITHNTDAAREIFAYIEQALAGLPLVITHEEFDGFPSLIVTTQRTKAPTLWLSAHVDVVPAPDACFTPREVDGRLYGRGSYDMKFAVAYYLTLLQELGARCREYDLGLMLTSDEEVFGLAGTGALLTRGGYGGELAFVPDGGGPFRLMRHAKGIYALRVHATGENAHSSKPWHGRSATSELVRFLAALQTELDALIAHDDPEHWHPTYNIGQIHGGEAFNQVAAAAEATVDIRYPDPTSKQQVIDVVTRLATAHPYISLETTLDAADHGADVEHPCVTAYAAAVRSERGHTPDWSYAHGSSDGRFFYAAGMRVIIDRPDGGNIHGDDEWLDLESFAAHYRVLRRFVDAVAHRAAN